MEYKIVFRIFVVLLVLVVAIGFFADSEPVIVAQDMDEMLVSMAVEEGLHLMVLLMRLSGQMLQH